MVLCNDWALVVVLDVASDVMVPSRKNKNHKTFHILKMKAHFEIKPFEGNKT